MCVGYFFLQILSYVDMSWNRSLCMGCFYGMTSNGEYNVKGKMVNCFVMASNLGTDQSAL